MSGVKHSGIADVHVRIERKRAGRGVPPHRLASCEAEAATRGMNFGRGGFGSAPTSTECTGRGACAAGLATRMPCVVAGFSPGLRLYEKGTTPMTLVCIPIQAHAPELGRAFTPVSVRTPSLSAPASDGNMSLALFWVLLALVLLIGEVFTVGFVLGALALAAFAAALSAWTGAALWLQILVFALASALLSALARPLSLRFLHPRGAAVQTNTAALVGAEAMVTEPIDPLASTGRVKVRGDHWRAVPENGLPIAPGTRVLVTEVEGATLRVVPHP